VSLEKEIKELVCAGFSGIWVESQECDDAIASIRRVTEEKEWGFDVWTSIASFIRGTRRLPARYRLCGF